MKIGTLADWFHLGVIEGIRESKRCDAEGVQLYASGELNPQNATKSFIAEVKKVLKENDQIVTALCAELGGHGIEIREDNKEKIKYLKQTIDLAQVFNCNIITTHIGIIPEDVKSDKYKVMQEAAYEISKYAKSCNAYVAIETGSETVESLVKFIDSVGDGLSVNYDPANLVMVTNDDEVKGVYTAGKRITHTHAKDGICNNFAGCEKVYGIFADGGIEALNTVSTYFTETPLGEGKVRWVEYIKALKDVGYDGFLTIEREINEGVGHDIKNAVKFLRNLI